MLNTPFGRYMAECEGMDNLISTRQAKLNAAGRDLHRAYQYGYGFGPQLVSQVLDNHGIDQIDAREYETLHRWAVLGHA